MESNQEINSTAVQDNAAHILIVDDDERIRELLANYFRKNGFRVTTTEDTSIAEKNMQNLAFDLIILDVMMPGESGTDFAERLRRQGNTIPIVMLTALGELKDRIAGLETGIDDYMTKPFQPQELKLRVVNILKRCESINATEVETNEISLGQFLFHVERGVLSLNGQPIKLTEREQDMLRLFSSNTGRTITRSELAATNGCTERAVDVQVNRLRQKIEQDPSNPVYLQTIRGKGYILHKD